ncbi:MAG: hypothetical protein OSJ28_08895 [Desulfovibrio sp.]|jgi:hypothetical protein|nr:hypothetical protein [Desulfovibrio sp.]
MAAEGSKQTQDGDAPVGMQKKPVTFKTREEAYNAYLYYRMHPTPRQWLQNPLPDVYKQHLEKCKRCQNIYKYVDDNRHLKSGVNYSRIDGKDFSGVSVGDIRTLAFEYLVDSKKGKFLNAPEVCVLTVPPKLSFYADIIVAQAIPERFELLMTKDDIRVPSAGYFVEGWNIFSVPMMALIEYRQTLFPSVYIPKTVQRSVINALHGCRNKKFPTQPDAVIEKFRLNEKAIGQKVKQYSYMAYRPD